MEPVSTLTLISLAIEQHIEFFRLQLSDDLLDARIVLAIVRLFAFLRFPRILLNKGANTLRYRVLISF